MRSYILIYFLIIIQYSIARTIYINNITGSDSASGLNREYRGDDGPIKSILSGVELASPGDVIFIEPTSEPYHEEVKIVNKHGKAEPYAPITIEGNGAVIDGSRFLTEAECKQVSPGLYKWPAPVQRDFELRRRAIIFDGKLERMGRCTKSIDPLTEFKEVEDLKFNEWTYDKSEKVYYIKIEPSKKVSTVRVPVILSGIAFRYSDYFVIRNLAVVHVINDGFSFTLDSHHIKLENICAVECGDDGFTTHLGCHSIEVDGFIATRNGTGICSTGTSLSSSSFAKNCILYQNMGKDYNLWGPGYHEISDSLIRSDKGLAFYIENPSSKAIQRSFARNVFIIGNNDQNSNLKTSIDTEFYARNITLYRTGLDIQSKYGLFVNSVVLGGADSNIKVPNKGGWLGYNNLYKISNIAINGTAIENNSDFQLYHKTSGNEGSSQWFGGDEKKDMQGVQFSGEHGANIQKLLELEQKLLEKWNKVI